jgi:hypothetical protein
VGWEYLTAVVTPGRMSKMKQRIIEERRGVGSDENNGSDVKKALGMMATAFFSLLGSMSGPRTIHTMTTCVAS